MALERLTGFCERGLVRPEVRCVLPHVCHDDRSVATAAAKLVRAVAALDGGDKLVCEGLAALLQPKPSMEEPSFTRVLDCAISADGRTSSSAWRNLGRVVAKLLVAAVGQADDLSAPCVLSRALARLPPSIRSVKVLAAGKDTLMRDTGCKGLVRCVVEHLCRALGVRKTEGDEAHADPSKCLEATCSRLLQEFQKGRASKAEEEATNNKGALSSGTLGSLKEDMAIIAEILDF